MLLMREIIIKAYGWLELADNNKHSTTLDKARDGTENSSNINLNDCLNSLHAICREWYLDESIFFLEDNLLQITHEGDYFPHEDVAMVLAKYISKESKGKLDIIDLEEWTLLRFFLDAEHNSVLLKNEHEKLPYSRKSSLNHVLEASQNKNSSPYKPG